jgi:hypothetical protein
VNALLRKVAPKLSPQMEISVTGDKIKIIMKTGLFTSEDLFSIDEEYMKEIQGIWMKVILFHLILFFLLFYFSVLWFLSSSCVLCTQFLSVSLDWPFLISPSVFSNVL